MSIMTTEVKTERPLARGIRETAALVGLSPAFIRKAIDSGDLRSTRIGRRVLVKDADLLEWINAPGEDPRKQAA
jgi:excisionase family DNA binding protein